MQIDFPFIPLQLTRSRHDGETRMNLNWITNRGAGLAERRTTVGTHFYSDHLVEQFGAKDPETAVIIDGKVYHDRVVHSGDEVVHRVTAEQVHASEELSALREELDRQARESEAELTNPSAAGAGDVTLESALFDRD